MRRLLFSILAMSFISFAVGCRTTHGVCDCDCDMDNSCGCSSGGCGGGGCGCGSAMIDEMTPHSDMPAPAPEIREALPNAPKKL